MQNADTTKSYLIEDAIKYGKNNSFTLENTSLYNQIDQIKIPTSNLFYEKYRGLILNNCVKVKIPENGMVKYKFRPKLLSYDLYGTVDLWYLLLWINNMYSSTQFNEQTIYIFNPDKINILVRIVNMEAEVVYENKNNTPIVDIELEKNITRR